MIAVFEADERCRNVFKQITSNIFKEDISVIKSQKDYEAISIFIHSKITKEVLELLPNLKYIQTRSTGYDHIDIKECKKRGIAVTNVQGYAKAAVAEFAFSLILNISRKTYIAIQRTKEENFYYKDLLGFELENKTIGVVGLGSIGRQICKIANGFGMNILAYTRHFDEEFIKKYNIKKSSYENLLKESDIIVFALPLTKETYHMLNKENISLIKKSAVVINIARGEIISFEALKTLQNKIYALGLDVIENEKDINKEKKEFIKKENILYTPHMAYYTKEALNRIEQISFDNMKKFLKKEELSFRIV